MGFLDRLLGDKSDKVRDSYLNRWDAIVHEFKLGLNRDQYYYIASALGKAEGKGWFKKLFSGKGVFGVILGVAGAVLTGGALGFVAGALSVAGSVYSAITAQKSAKIQSAINAVASHTAMLKAKAELYSEKDTLTDLIVYTGYEIYAGGWIYNRNRAGSESFSPSLAFDSTKGIRGEPLQDLSDEQIMNRAHFSKAGNAGYMSEALDMPFGLARGGLNHAQIQDSLENNIKRNSKRIVEGFTRLAQEKFNFTGDLEGFYKQVAEKQLHPTGIKYIVNDFLEKNKNYNLALRADFRYLSLKDLFPKKESDEKRKNRLKTRMKQNVHFQAEVKRRIQAHLDLNFKAELQGYIEGEFDIKFPFWSSRRVYYEKIINGKLVYKRPGFNARSEYIENLDMLFEAYTHIGKPVFSEGGEKRYKRDSRGRIMYDNYTLLESVKEEFLKKRKNELHSAFENELLEREIGILHDVYFIQKSLCFSKDEKAKDHIQTLHSLFLTLRIVINDDLVPCFKNEKYEYMEGAEKKTLALEKMNFVSLGGVRQSFFIANPSPIALKIDFEEFLRLNGISDNNSLRTFYFELLKNFGTFTGTGEPRFNKKGFVYRTYAAFFTDDEEFEALKSPIFYDEGIKKFNFNSFEPLSW